jgi:predicted nucleic acid-binding Zn finger protein
MVLKKMVLPPTELTRLGKKELTQSDIEFFKKKYGKKFVRALKIVEDGDVVKYQFNPSETTTWVVQGRKRQYMTIPNTYCTCRSFYQDVVISRETNMCYHLLAQKIAEVRNQYETRRATDTDRRQLYVDWRRTD